MSPAFCLGFLGAEARYYFFSFVNRGFQVRCTTPLRSFARFRVFISCRNVSSFSSAMTGACCACSSSVSCVDIADFSLVARFYLVSLFSRSPADKFHSALLASLISVMQLILPHLPSSLPGAQVTVTLHLQSIRSDLQHSSRSRHDQQFLSPKNSHSCPPV